ncbi:FecR family protein [Agrobacterium sp. NPDC089420]|uniref:FecR family protein n=1 Tax=Agrobacterium sp. NPDC089420 TaxID=3363918 RepID=UPI00384C6C62
MTQGKGTFTEMPAGRETDTPNDEAGIGHAAARWFAHFLEPGATAADESAFRRWIEADERHARAYADIERIWLGAGMAPELAQPLGRRRLLRNGVAGVLLIGAAGSWAWQAARPAGDYETAIGETRSIVLADGSTVELSTSSAISVDFTPQRRQITLLSGEAFFQVAPDPSRPFSVNAEELVTTALGTAFSVCRSASSVSVSVAEHAVEVAADRSRTAVEAGYSISYRDGVLSLPEATDMEARLAWRQGKLVFISTPLKDVVARLEQWRRGRMIVIGEALGKQPVTMIVDVRRREKIGQILEEGLPVTVTDYSPWLSVIRPR